MPALASRAPSSPEGDLALLALGLQPRPPAGNSPRVEQQFFGEGGLDRGSGWEMIAKLRRPGHRFGQGSSKAPVAHWCAGAGWSMEPACSRLTGLFRRCCLHRPPSTTSLVLIGTLPPPQVAFKLSQPDQAKALRDPSPPPVSTG